MGLAAYPLGSLTNLKSGYLNPILCFSSIIMTIDKSWIDLERNTPEYKQGLASFIEMCRNQVDSDGNIRCPCRRCCCSGLIPFSKMISHLYILGFWKEYVIWTYHGENLASRVVSVDNVVPRHDMDGVIQDLIGETYMEVDDEDADHDDEDENMGACDDFEELIEEVESELYPGCTKFSSLDFLSKLVHLKVKNKWTNSSFTNLLELLQESHPEGNKFPPRMM